MLLVGNGIRPGVYSRRVCPTGLHRTLCQLMGISPSEKATGELLSESIADEAAARD
jgi:hypothetical protein